MLDLVRAQIVGFLMHRLSYFVAVVLHSEYGSDSHQNIDKTLTKHLKYQEKNMTTIRKTCPSNVYPLIPHFYIANLGYAGIY